MQTAIALAAAFLALSADLPDMETRGYPVAPSLIDVVAGHPTYPSKDPASPPNSSPQGTNEDIQRFFEEMGVPFPPGSDIQYRRADSTLVVRNTPENLELFERIIAGGCEPSQVEIDVSFVAFDLKTIEEAAREADGAAPSGETIRELWREGYGRLLATGKVVTRSGVNAQVQGADEVIYAAGPAPTHPEFPGEAESLAPGLPAAFDTRETGLILNVTPTVAPDVYTLDLTLEVELVDEVGWMDAGTVFGENGKRWVALRQPRFFTHRLNSSVVLWNGETIVAAGMLNRERTEIVYVFLTAHIIDEAGKRRPSWRESIAGAPSTGGQQTSAAMALATAMLGQSAAPMTMQTRAYFVSPHFVDIAAQDLQERPIPHPGQGRNEQIKRFFESRGVPFPPGSSIEHRAGHSVLVVRNKPENLQSFERVLGPRGPYVPYQVEIDASFIAFDLKTIEEAARRTDGAAPSAEAVRALWRDGRGRLLATGKVVTRSGVNAQAQGADEVIYAAGPPIAPPGDPGSAESRLSDARFVLETRETGLILNATPVVGPDGEIIDLTLVPELADEVAWRDAGVDFAGDGEVPVSFQQPRFFTHNVTTAVVLRNGETIVTAAMLNRERTEIVYVLLTARLINPAGTTGPAWVEMDP